MKTWLCNFLSIPFLLVLISWFLSNGVLAQKVTNGVKVNAGTINLLLENGLVSLNIIIKDSSLQSDSLSGQARLPGTFGNSPQYLVSDAGFIFDIVWADWQAPGKKYNAENPVLLNKGDFYYTSHSFHELQDRKTELELNFRGKDYPLKLRVTYQLEDGKFYFKRKLSIADSTTGGHFLEKIAARSGEIWSNAEVKVIKKGDFGQPIALAFGECGTFLGLEYPASENIILQADHNKASFSCSQEMGMKIGRDWIESEWVVEALVPTSHARDWFFNYVKDIRVMPAEPYILYNSWYDLRSPEYKDVKPGNVMNQENVFRIIDLLKKNMIDKHNIHLDAFVLDDGWDVYKSDWILRKETFPKGLMPISQKLNQSGTSLGIWFGPTGGYSFHTQRISWMKDHQYETVGHGDNNDMLCLAGMKYSRLFEKRVTGMVSEGGVAYFKWDGIQFSCSEPDHGHPVGIYSRRAVLESLIGKCQAVRRLNPQTYLNITSGTWLSPWFVKYANQIWMQGEDYGFSQVPSIHKRDAAMTYKDAVLYDDFQNLDLWFPISNMMTHGLIKGNLESVGGEDDPIAKFTNDAVFYVARGVSMIELYISPDLLKDEEWEAIGKAIQWAKANKDILGKTCMTGGDPTKSGTYAYIHCKGDHAIVAARNPAIETSKLSLTLDPSYGLSEKAANLVVEKVYPYRYILPGLYKTGSKTELPLEGFETAIYEIYPLESAAEPMPAGARFYTTTDPDGNLGLHVYQCRPESFFLNSQNIREMKLDGKTVRPTRPAIDTIPAIEPYKDAKVVFEQQKQEIGVFVSIDSSVLESTIAVLIRSPKGSIQKDLPVMKFLLDGKETTASKESQKGCWDWYSIKATPGKHSFTIIPASAEMENREATASVWLVSQQKMKTTTFTITPTKEIKPRILPPLPYPQGVTEKNSLLGEVNFTIKANVK